MRRPPAGRTFFLISSFRPRASAVSAHCRDPRNAMQRGSPLRPRPSAARGRGPATGEVFFGKCSLLDPGTCVKNSQTRVLKRLAPPRGAQDDPGSSQLGKTTSGDTQAVATDPPRKARTLVAWGARGPAPAGGRRAGGPPPGAEELSRVPDSPESSVGWLSLGLFLRRTDMAKKAKKAAKKAKKAKKAK